MGGCVGSKPQGEHDTMKQIKMIRKGNSEIVSNDEIYILHLIYQDLA